MIEFLENLPPVRWFLDQFAPCPELDPTCEPLTAAGLFRFVLLAWVVAAAVFILADRFGSLVLGRSRPLAQEPPERARTWRWRAKSSIPTNYSRLPAGTVVDDNQPALSMRETTLVVPELPALASDVAVEPVVAEPTPEPELLPDATINLADSAYWQLVADRATPAFGLENVERLKNGEAPERFNPVLGRVETLQRNSGEAALSWPATSHDVLDLRHDQTGDASTPEANSGGQLVGDEEE